MRLTRLKSLGQAAKITSLNAAMNTVVKGDLDRIRTRALEIALDRNLPRARRVYKLEAEVYTVADLAARYCLQISTVYAGLRDKSSLLPRPLRADPWSIRRKFLFTAKAIRCCDKARAAFYAGVRGEDPELSQAR